MDEGATADEVLDLVGLKMSDEMIFVETVLYRVEFVCELLHAVLARKTESQSICGKDDLLGGNGLGRRKERCLKTLAASQRRLSDAIAY